MIQPVIKQLIIGVFVLILVTIVSFGIRRARISIDRPESVGSPADNQNEPISLPTDSNSVDYKSGPEYSQVKNLDAQKSSDDYSETYSDINKNSKVVSQIEQFKGEYTKAKGSKGLEKVSLGGNDNLYRTANGQYWYVSKGSNGKSFKMQVQIDESSGKVIGVGNIYGGKSSNSASPEKISLGGNEDIYITEEGRTWYVTDNYKAQVEIDDNTGEITVLEQHSDDDK